MAPMSSPRPAPSDLARTTMVLSMLLGTVGQALTSAVMPTNPVALWPTNQTDGSRPADELGEGGQSKACEYLRWPPIGRELQRQKALRQLCLGSAEKPFCSDGVPEYAPSFWIEDYQSRIQAADDRRLRSTSGAGPVLCTETEAEYRKHRILQRKPPRLRKGWPPPKLGKGSTVPCGGSTRGCAQDVPPELMKDELAEALLKHPNRTMVPTRATIHIYTLRYWKDFKRLLALPPRSPQTPYLIFFLHLKCFRQQGLSNSQQAMANEYERQGQSTAPLAYPASAAQEATCRRNLEKLALRQDVVLASIDLGSHVRSDDRAQMPGITYPSPRTGRYETDCESKAVGNSTYLLTFRGSCNHQMHTTARRDLARIMKVNQRDDVVYECSDGKEGKKKEVVKVRGARHGKDGSSRRVERYHELMRTLYGIVPHGDSRWNIRFSEAVSAGVVPVLVADGLTLPFENLVDWRYASVYLEEATVRAAAGQGDPVEALEFLMSLLPQSEERSLMKLNVCKLRNEFLSSMRLLGNALLRSALKYALNRQQYPAFEPYDSRLEDCTSPGQAWTRLHQAPALEIERNETAGGGDGGGGAM